MNKGEIIGVLAGLALSLLWILLYPTPKSQSDPIVFLVGWNMFLNFICLPICCIYYWDERLLRYIFLALYVLYFGFWSMTLSSLARNWVIIPLMLVPFLNVFVYAGTALWLGFIGLGSIGIDTLIRSSFISAPFFLVLLTERLGKVMAVRLKKLELRMIESRIKEVEKIIKKNKDFLAQRNKLEEEINEIISFDPANLGLKAVSFRRQVKFTSDEQVRRRITEIDN